MGKLYIVSTPIGNLKDITLRAIEILNETEIILSEDTRKSSLLINLLIKNRDSKKKYISYFEQNEFAKIPELIYLLKSGHNIALVSDAGTPTISDPGFKLVRECIKEGIEIESIPGPTSVISSLVISGLPTDKFLFLGFLPKKSGNRTKLLISVKESLGKVNSTVIFFESPYRIIKTLDELEKIFGNVNVVLCRELTKIHEEIIRGKMLEVIDKLKDKNIKGEFVILFNLKSTELS